MCNADQSEVLADERTATSDAMGDGCGFKKYCPAELWHLESTDIDDD
jgi:hypothetical protein